MNYLAPFVLTSALLPLLRGSAPSRVLSLTAAVEPIGRLHSTIFKREQHFGGLRAYSQSKKALAMYTLELARRERELDSGVSANVIDPFLVKTGLTHAKQVPLLFKLARPVMVRPADSARWVARAALDSRLADTTGRHFILGHRIPSLSANHSRRQANRLWEISTRLTTSSRNPRPLKMPPRRSGIRPRLSDRGDRSTVSASWKRHSSGSARCPGRAFPKVCGTPFAARTESPTVASKVSSRSPGIRTASCCFSPKRSFTRRTSRPPRWQHALRRSCS